MPSALKAVLAAVPKPLKLVAQTTFFLKARSPKPRCWHGQALRACRASCLFRLLAATGSLCSLADGHIVPVSALLHAMFFLCVALSRVPALLKGQQLLDWVLPFSDVTSFYLDYIFKWWT